MPPLPDHLAYNCRRMAYLHGRTARVPKQVIRISQDKFWPVTRGSGAAKDNLAIVFSDKTGAGKQWSAKELDTTEKLAKSDLALVIGEIIPTAPGLEQKRFCNALAGFDEKEDCVIPTTLDAVVVVIRFSKGSNIFALCHKNDGVCDTLDLPKEMQDHVFFYSEWAGYESTRASSIYNGMRKNAATFIREYLETHVFLNVQQVSSKPEPAKVLQQGYVGQHSDSDNERIVKNLLVNRGRFDLGGAQEASEACKTLFRAGVAGRGELIFEPEFLLELARGLRRMSPPIMMSLVKGRALITHFCCMAYDGSFDAADPNCTEAMILEAYDRAGLTVGWRI